MLLEVGLASRDSRSDVSQPLEEIFEGVKIDSHILPSCLKFLERTKLDLARSEHLIRSLISKQNGRGA